MRNQTLAAILLLSGCAALYFWPKQLKSNATSLQDCHHPTENKHAEIGPSGTLSAHLQPEQPQNRTASLNHNLSRATPSQSPEPTEVHSPTETLEYTSSSRQILSLPVEILESKAEFYKEIEASDATSYDYESQIYNLILNDKRMSDYVLLGTECRTTSCKITFQIEDPDIHDALVNDFLPLIARNGNELNMTVEPTRNDNTVSFYLARNSDE